MTREEIKAKRKAEFERHEKNTTANKITATFMITIGVLCYVVNGDIPMMTYFGILSIPYILAKRNLTMF